MHTQSVCTNGVLSEPQPISFGVAQGRVLGPLLFMIYINDLPLAVQGCSVELYADDTLIYFASKSVSEIQAYGVSIQSSTMVREMFQQITQKLWAT